MLTRFELYDGVLLEVPYHPAFEWPTPGFAGFPACCGPGTTGSLGERIVRDRIRGIVLSPACWVHDFMWSEAEARTEAVFHYTNSVFLRNMLAIIAVRGKALPALRIKECVVAANLYHDVVATLGRPVFFQVLGGRA